MPLMCLNCAKDQVLNRFIRECSRQIGQCEVCRSRKVAVLDTKDRELRSMVRALVRYHYSEWDYNCHFGGKDLECLLMSDNLITNYSPKCNEDAYLDFTGTVFDKGYEHYEKGISLFAGYDENQQLPLLRSLKSDRTRKLRQLEQKLETENHFLLESEVNVLLKPFKAALAGTIPKGAVMFRARIGFEMKAMPQNGWGDEWHYKPYSAKKLGK